jgi:hypothetical protein
VAVFVCSNLVLEGAIPVACAGARIGLFFQTLLLTKNRTHYFKVLKNKHELVPFVYQTKH